MKPPGVSGKPEKSFVLQDYQPLNMDQTEDYIDKVGSLGAKDLKDTSLSDIRNIIKNEVKEHKETLAEKTQDVENNPCKFYFYLTKGKDFLRV